MSSDAEKDAHGDPQAALSELSMDPKHSGQLLDEKGEVKGEGMSLDSHRGDTY